MSAGVHSSSKHWSLIVVIIIIISLVIVALDALILGCRDQFLRLGHCDDLCRRKKTCVSVGIAAHGHVLNQGEEGKK